MSELKRRSVFRVAMVYLAVAWLLLQVVATVAPILELPLWFERAALLLLAIGFPIAFILAWAFEL
ncbi:MAG: FHA domain-containing protein, partial [Gammaproteobacteria bacterium]|nr:FHA domain-containing protein [Gammaproteobacteria bacterium]